MHKDYYDNDDYGNSSSVDLDNETNASKINFRRKGNSTRERSTEAPVRARETRGIRGFNFGNSSSRLRTERLKIKTMLKLRKNTKKKLGKK